MVHTAFITHNDCVKHDMGDYHPESPARLGAINDRLIAGGLMPYLEHHEAGLADRHHIERVHSATHVENIYSAAPRRGMVHLDPDTAMNPYTLGATLGAAGAGILAVDLVLQGKVENAFCGVRPPGHHAERDRPMGFCFFNSVAVAAAYALEHYGLERVAILDFDVHHGNGTEDIFRNDPRVLFCSTFQHPFYPYQGADTVSNHIVNIPLPAGTDGAGFREAIQQRCLPAFDAFSPQLILISAGFDAHREDPLAHLRLVEADYTWVTKAMVDLAGRHCGGALVSMLEGGYNVDALGRSVTEHVRVLAGI
ncbi:MAG: histone deacetylase family protein [Betaproteobacteria bacterium]|nr:histone deacetylase family protein [Betaproteobacteria bacterium]MDE2621902.1 histone deacetylase family protein [Betaproteobacteria bacterium]